MFDDFGGLNDFNSGFDDFGCMNDLYYQQDAMQQVMTEQNQSLFRRIINFIFF